MTQHEYQEMLRTALRQTLSMVETTQGVRTMSGGDARWAGWSGLPIIRDALAAPQLLEALNYLVEMVNDNCGSDFMGMDEARAAIRAAEGEK